MGKLDPVTLGLRRSMYVSHDALKARQSQCKTRSGKHMKDAIRGVEKKQVQTAVG